MLDSELTSALAEELTSANAFCTLLETEREALSAGNLEQVGLIAAQKLVLAQRLQQCSRAREELCSQANIQLRADTAEPRHYHSDSLIKPQIAALWTSVSAKLKQAQEANRINGLLISSRLATVGNALNALHEAAGNSAIYGSDGAARPVNSALHSARWQA